MCGDPCSLHRKNCMTSRNPWLLVSNPDYFRKVVGNMVTFGPNARHDRNIVVRFGLRGNGIQPNHRFEAPAGRVAASSGNNHRKDGQAPGGRYADNDLSVERFALQDVQDLMRRCLDIQSGKIDPAPPGEGP
jgi:hypothetical protein